MISFSQYLQEMVSRIDISDIASTYPKASIALQLVQKYDNNLLHGIIAIMNLETNAYGETEQESEGIIRVNVNKIIEKFRGDDKKIILEIASTIIHECVHKAERRNSGGTSEGGAKEAEQRFLKWANQKI